MKQLLNFLDKYFGYIILLMICLIKFYLGHLRYEPAFITTALCLLGVAVLHFLIIIVTAQVIETRYKQEADEWISVNKHRRGVSILAILFSDIGLVTVIILWNAISFYLVIYLLNWPETFVFIALTTLLTEVNGYFRSKKKVLDPPPTQ